MRDWANEYGRAVRQRSIRQETTKFKAGTLPLNMYRGEQQVGDAIELSFTELHEEVEDDHESTEYDSDSSDS